MSTSLSPKLDSLFVDISGAPASKPRPWGPLLVPRESIDAEIRRLAAMPRPTNGRRSSAIVHPFMRGDTLGLTPGTLVTLNVLRPGEETLPRRESSNQIEITIAGAGTVIVEEPFEVGFSDVWTIPPMRTYSHRNTGRELWVRLTYSNATLLERLGVLFAEEGSAIRSEESQDDGLTSQQRETYVREKAPDLAIGEHGARLRGYEYLTDIAVLPERALLWPWRNVEPHINTQLGDGKRSIMLMYNPATERRAGTTQSFFATWAGCAPRTPPFPPTRGHRHTSASINYHTRGSGRSVVDGKTVEWKAGDLLFSAPSWSEHTHYPGPDGWMILTIQDHPMHISLGSLLWQEKMGGPIHSLGTERGQTGYTAPREPGR